jgi:dihydrofolate reductase
MRKIVNSTYISLDGVVDHMEGWPPVPASDDEERRYGIQNDLLQSCDILIMGRRTYEGFAPAWSARSGDPVSDRFNAMRKYVVSATLTDPDWNNTSVISQDPVGAIRALKEESGGDIVQYGFGQLSLALLEAGLLDELRLWIHPFFVGHGGPADLLYRDTAPAAFELVDVTTLKSGMVITTHRYTGPAAS